MFADDERLSPDGCSLAFPFWTAARNFSLSFGFVIATTFSPWPLKSSQTRLISSPRAGFTSCSQSSFRSSSNEARRNRIAWSPSGNFSSSSSIWFHWLESAFGIDRDEGRRVRGDDLGAAGSGLVARAATRERERGGADQS